MQIGLSTPLIGSKNAGWWSYEYFVKDTSINTFQVTFENKGRLEGKMKELFEAVKAEAVAAGAKEAEKAARMQAEKEAEEANSLKAEEERQAAAAALVDVANEEMQEAEG